VDITHAFVRERVMRRQVQLQYISTDYMVADALTKAVNQGIVTACRQAMGLI